MEMADVKAMKCYGKMSKACSRVGAEQGSRNWCISVEAGGSCMPVRASTFSTSNTAPERELRD